MKQWIFFAIALALAAMLAGCGGSGEAAEDDNAADSTQTQQAQEDQGTEEMQNNDVTQSQGQQTFTSLELEVDQGTLYIRLGDTFSLARRDGDAVDYEISDGVLRFDQRQTGDVVLTLPREERYEKLRLDVGDGHVYAEESMTVQTLALTVERGEVTMEGISVENGSEITIEQGSAFLSGALDGSVTADCREGHLSLQVSAAKDAYNYTVEVSEGELRLGGDQFHGRKTSKTIDNGADRTMSLTCSRGDLSVEFEK